MNSITLFRKFLMVCIVALMLFQVSMSSAQNQDRIIQEIQAYQTSLSNEFSDPDKTILKPEDFATFEGLSFYPIDLSLRVTARIERTPEAIPFLMPTTTDRLPQYVMYGRLFFSLFGQELTLAVYQNTQGHDDPEYANDLFLPFTDWTSGDGAYGGGRYIDLLIPDGDFIVLDFNQSYNPYCAYNERYSCPIPPQENDLPVRIEAGVKAFDHH